MSWANAASRIVYVAGSASIAETSCSAVGASEYCVHCVSPATSVVLSRSRFCVSAGHTRADLEAAVKDIAEIAKMLKLRYAKSSFG